MQECNCFRFSLILICKKYYKILICWFMDEGHFEVPRCFTGCGSDCYCISQGGKQDLCKKYIKRRLRWLVADTVTTINCANVQTYERR